MRGDIGDVLLVLVVPNDLLFGEDVIGVHLATVRVDLLTVGIGKTATSFEMVTNTREICEFLGTPGASITFANVY